MAAKFTRRQYYINRKFQSRFILKFIAILVLGALLSICITLITTEPTLTSSFDGSNLVIEKTSWAILPSLVLTNIISTLIIAVIAGGVTLLVSHKIAGPMLRFELDFKQIADGDLSKTIRIRNGDQFEGMAKQLNEMVQSLNGRVKEVFDETDALIETAAENDAPEAVQTKLKEFKEELAQKFTV